MIRTLFEMVGRDAPAPSLTEAQWRELLTFADRTQLTLHLRLTPGLPRWIVDEISDRHAKNAERRRRLRDAYGTVARAFEAAEIDFVLLKGFTHEVGFGIDGSVRVQYDLDILVQPDHSENDAQRARMALERLDYAPHSARSLSEEHERPFVQPSSWIWRGDYYDPEMPIPVELHESAWNARREHVHPEGIEDFWHRREEIHFDGVTIPSFAKVDRLAFAALHVLRHILRHDAKPAHVLELARFLVLVELTRDPMTSGANGSPYTRPSCGPYRRLPFALLTNGSAAHCRMPLRPNGAECRSQSWPGSETSPGPPPPI
jgi:hypothetical protein